MLIEILLNVLDRIEPIHSVRVLGLGSLAFLGSLISLSLRAATIGSVAFRTPSSTSD